MSNVLNRLAALEKTNPVAPAGTREWHFIDTTTTEHNCDVHESCYMTSQPNREPVRFMRVIERGEPE